MNHPITLFRKENGLSLEAFGEPFAVNKTTVMRWEENGVPAERVLDLERQWGISRHDLRPDIYPRDAA